MSPDLDLIERWVIKDHYGMITPEEKAQLEDATDRYPEAWRRQQQILEKIKSPDLKQYLEEHTDEQQLARLLARYRRYKRRRIIIVGLLVVGATALMVYAFRYWILA